MKTNKSYTKRLKVTKNGKIIARKPNQNHFRSRKTGQQKLEGKRSQVISLVKKTAARFLPGHKTE